MASNSKTKVVTKSAQQMIAEIEMMKLLQIVQQRPLTLEEAKIYDLLCKNLNLSEGKATEMLDAQYRIVEEEKAKKIPSDSLIKKALEVKSTKKDG